MNLAEAQKSLEFLLLPREHTFSRPSEHCFDVNTSTDRSKLLEKFLRKRYTLIEETGGVKLGTGSLNNENCQLELKTTKKKKIESMKAQIGSTNNISSSSQDLSVVSTSQILLGLGKPGTLELEGQSLYVECTGGVRGIYQLVFSYSEELRTKIKSEATVRQGESVQIGQIISDLNNKRKVLGLPESTYQEALGSENINYELQIK